MTISVEVADDSQLATDIKSWEDGATYSLTVKQTGTGTFEGISGEPEEETPEEESEANEEPESGPPMPKMGMMGSKMGGKSGEMPPAIIIAMGKHK